MDVVCMPELGESITEGKVTKWLKKPGDRVALYEPICEVMTDKVNAEIPSPRGGVLVKIFVPEGDMVDVGKPICQLLDEQDLSETKTVFSSSRSVDESPIGSDNEVNNVSSGKSDQVVAKDDISIYVPVDQTPDLQQEDDRAVNKENFVSPVVMRLVSEHNLDLSTILGTGNGGRITKKDILTTIDSKNKAASASGKESEENILDSWNQNEDDLSIEPLIENESSSTQTLATIEEHLLDSSCEDVPDIENIPLTPMRRAISTRMKDSWQHAPQAWLMMNADVTGLVNLHSQEYESFQKREGIKLTYLPFFLQATSFALRKHPYVNSTFTDEGIHLYKLINISIAVAHDDGLYTPVLKDAANLSLTGLAHSAHDLINCTKSGKLTLDHFKDGTFTLNNTGVLGTIASRPILNPPQAAIVTFEAIQKVPKVINNMLAIRDCLNICLTIDHRVLDGASAAAFLTTIKEYLESYSPSSVHWS